MTTENLSVEALLDLALENIEPDLTDYHEAASLTEASGNLVALGATLSQYEPNAALIQFADHEGVLSKIIPAIPSLESFNADPANYNAEAAQEAILQKIKETAGKWLAAIGGAIKRYKHYLMGAGALVASAAAAIVAIKVHGDKVDHGKIAGLLEHANGTMAQLEHHKGAEAFEIDEKIESAEGATENLDFKTVVFNHFGENMSPAAIVQTCHSNVEKVQGILRKESSNIDELETMARRLEGASHPDQLARQKEIHEKLSVSRTFVAMLLKTVRAQRQVAGAVQSATVH